MEKKILQHLDRILSLPIVGGDDDSRGWLRSAQQSCPREIHLRQVIVGRQLIVDSVPLPYEQRRRWTFDATLPHCYGVSSKTNGPTLLFGQDPRIREKQVSRTRKLSTRSIGRIIG